MCCRLIVSPLDPAVAETILRLGLFVPRPGYANGWQREAEGGTAVIAYFETDRLLIHLSPSISTYAQHADKRVAGGIFFEIAAKYAEKVGGTIIQSANVVGCVEGGGGTERLLAAYPEHPLLWESVCAGFREVIMGGMHEHH